MDVSRRSVLAAAAALLVVPASGCASEFRRPAPTTSAPAGSAATATSTAPPASPTVPITVGTPGPPSTLDPALAADSETHRVTRQIAETLLGVDVDTGAPVPLLATDWSVTSDGLRYTFSLRQDVRFHDGTPLEAEAVAANVNRWSRLPEILGEETLAALPHLSFASVFGGYAGEEGCRLVECRSIGEHTVSLTLSEPIVFLAAALTSPAFAITSPGSWRMFDDALDAAAGELPEARPAGTGPYRWPEDPVPLAEAAAPGGVGIELQVWEEYWGPAPLAGPVVLSVTPRAVDRLRDLHRGELDAFDVVTPELLRPLVQGGAQVLQRDPVSVLYLGMNLDHPVTRSLYVRQAVAHAVDRRALVNEEFLTGTSVAQQFLPPSLGLDPPDLPSYNYDLDEARRLLALSGYDGEPLEFLYPVHVSRPFLPSPEDIYARIAGDLGTVGLVLNPVPVPWDGNYTQRVLQHRTRAFHLSGRTAPFRDPHSFLGPLFGHPNPEFGYANGSVIDALQRAVSTQDTEARHRLYGRATESVLLDLPALPLAFPISAVAVGHTVQSYPISPVLDERFDRLVPATPS